MCSQAGLRTAPPCWRKSRPGGEQWRQWFRHLDRSHAHAARLQEDWAERVRREVADLNRQIRDLNLALPLWRLEVVPLQPEDELAQASTATAED